MPFPQDLADQRTHYEQLAAELAASYAEERRARAANPDPVRAARVEASHETQVAFLTAMRSTLICLQLLAAFPDAGTVGNALEVAGLERFAESLEDDPEILDELEAAVTEVIAHRVLEQGQ